MKEEEWLGCNDEQRMLSWLRRTRRRSERQARLFAVACCRRIWAFLTHKESRRAVEVAQWYADGQVAQETLEAASTGAAQSYETSNLMYAAQIAAACTCSEDGMTAAADGSDWASRAAAAVHAEHTPAWGATLVAEQRAQAALLRHIIGNPFRTDPAPDRWPAAITQLADALYNCEEWGFALHEALLEAGHPELADHFRSDQHHPKGCWVVDLLTGRS